MKVFWLFQVSVVSDIIEIVLGFRETVLPDPSQLVPPTVKSPFLVVS